ncbi:MAG: hypothetical protein H0W87_01105 [Actinobacteria bacterium]|nr:hypothetical protein [Actinomycetota bacterium]
MTSRDKRDFDELDAEREVDLRRYWNALVTRWWLPIAGLVAGLIIGYLLTLGGNQVYEATALVSLGTPYAGTSPIQGLPTNSTYVDRLVHSEYAARIAAAKAGLRPGQVRNNVSTKAVSGGKGTLKAGQTPLYEISLTGAVPRKVQAATLSLSNQVISRISGYVDTKISGYETLLSSLNAQLDSNRLRINSLRRALANASGLSQLDQLVIVTQLDNAVQQSGTLLQNKTTTEGQLSLAKDVEKPRIIAPPVPTKTTARSTRNSMLVGGVIGLLLGIVAALLSEPVLRRVRER